MARLMASVLLLAVAMIGMFGSSAAWDHIIGRSKGWTVPPNATFYQDWAHGREFVVGDKLVFMFTTGAHSVIEVAKDDFEGCLQNDVVDMFNKGPLVLRLDRPGMHYYYCGIGTHCEFGQKLSINVLQKSSSHNHHYH